MIIERLYSSDAETACLVLTQVKFAEDGTGYLAEALSVDSLRDFLKDDRHYLLAALEGNTPVGYILAYRLRRVDRAQDMMFFYEIGVVQQYRRTGIGTALIGELKEICKQENILKMFVLTDRSNTAAYHLYAKTGGTAKLSGDEVTFVYRDFT